MNTVMENHLKVTAMKLLELVIINLINNINNNKYHYGKNG